MHKLIFNLLFITLKNNDTSKDYQQENKVNKSNTDSRHNIYFRH